MKNTIKTLALIASLCSFQAASAGSQETALPHKFELSKKDYAPGTRQYLVYMEDLESGEFRNQALWTRTTKLVEREGETFVEVTQKWSSSTPNWNRELYSLNRLSDFSPVTHQTIHGSDNTVSAYLFNTDTVAGNPNVPDNSKADFSIAKEAETLNWELDMETFSLLPFELGRTFKLNFYHPGSRTKSKVYDYIVSGEETLTDMTGNKIDCWILHIKYGEEGFSDFYIDKKSKQLVKMVEDYGKFRRYKILLSVPFGPAGRT